MEHHGHVVATILVDGSGSSEFRWSSPLGSRHGLGIAIVERVLGRSDPQADDWCKEHNVAESHCIECKAGLVPAEKEYGWCKKHGVAECPLEHPDIAQLKSRPSSLPRILSGPIAPGSAAPGRKQPSLQVLQAANSIDSAAAVEKAGVDIAVVGRRPMIEAVVANGEVVFDEHDWPIWRAESPGPFGELRSKLASPFPKATCWR